MSSKVHSWDDFKARKAAGEPAAAEPPALEEQLAESIKIAQRARKPKRPAPAAESLADVLQKAVRLAVGRARLPKREVVVREQTLLDVLVEALRGGAA